MSTTRLRRPAPAAHTLDLGRVLRSSASALRDRGPFLLGAALLVFAPIAVWDATVDWLEVIDERSRNDATLLAVVGAVLLGLVLTNLGALFYSGLLGQAVAAERAKGRPATLGSTLRSLPYLRLLAVELLYLGAVVVGLILLVVPGILAFAWFALAGPLTTLDDMRPIAAMRRSFQLVRGNELRVLAIVGAAFVAEAVVGGAIALALPETGVLGWVAALARNVIVAPFLGVATVVITLELGRVAGFGPQLTRPRRGG